MTSSNMSQLFSGEQPQQQCFQFSSNNHPSWYVMEFKDTVLAKSGLFVFGLSQSDHVLAYSVHEGSHTESITQTFIHVGKNELPIIVTVSIQDEQSSMNIKHDVLGQGLPSFVSDTYQAMEVLSGLELLLHLSVIISSDDKSRAMKELSLAIQYAESLDNLAFAEDTSDIDRTDFLERFNQSVEQAIYHVSGLLKFSNNSDFNWDLNF